MNNDSYVVSFQCAGKVYVLGKQRPVLLNSRSVAALAVREVFKSACEGNALSMIATAIMDFRVHRAETIPSRPAATAPVLPWLSGVIIPGPRAKAWHSRGARPFAGPKVPRRRFAKKKPAGYNREHQPSC